MRIRPMTIAALLAAAGAASAAAADDWTLLNGPWQAQVSLVESVGDTLFASTSSGLYRSTDAGQTWSLAFNRTSGYFGLAGLSGEGDQVFAILGDGRLIHSANRGATWQDLDTPFTYGWSAAVSFSQGHLYISGVLDPNVSNRTVAFHSTDLGQSFAPIAQDDADASISITFSQGPIVIVSKFPVQSYNTQVKKSTDGGETFTDIGILPISDIAFADGRLYASGGGGGALMVSTDLGDSFQPMQIATPGDVHVSNVAAHGANLIVTGYRLEDPLGDNGPSVWSSSNHGLSWSRAETGLDSAGDLVFSASLAIAGDDAILAGPFGAFAANLDSLSWKSAETGISNLRVGAMTVAGDTLLVSRDRQQQTWQLKSGDQDQDGGAWIPSSLPIGSDADDAAILSLSTSPTGVIFAGTSDDGLFRSTDTGATWSPSGTGLPAQRPIVDVIGGEAAAAATLFAVMGGFEEYLPGRGLAPYLGSQGIFKSTDDGATWTQSSTGLPVVGVNFEGRIIYDALTDIAVDGATLLVGTRTRGVYRSINGGASWQAASLSGFPRTWGGGPAEVTAIESTPVGVFVAVSGHATGSQALARSTNGGVSWTPAGASLSHRPARDIAWFDGSLYIGVGENAYTFYSDGVFKSDDAGASWQQIGDTLIGLGAVRLAVFDDALYAGTPSGVWKLTGHHEGGCPADHDLSGAVDSNDFFSFLEDFFAGNADIDHSGATDSTDFFTFLTAFFTGC